MNVKNEIPEEVTSIGSGAFYSHKRLILNLSPQIGWNLSGCKPYVSRLLEMYQKYGVFLKVPVCREGEVPAVFDAAAPDLTIG